MASIGDKLDYVDAVADAFLDLAAAELHRGDASGALNYTHVAATVLCKQNRWLASPRIESTLLSIAAALPEMPSGTPRPDACVHVLREALPAGGLTNMAARWMRTDDSGRRHHAVLLQQKTPVPQAFRDAVETTGGTIHVADVRASFLEQAVWLRQLTATLGDYVILHVHNADVVCAAAFGVSGGPRVLFVNHSAHAFWVGVAISDMVLNVRGSAQENAWTEYRGARRYATVPIPLLPADLSSVHDDGHTETKRLAKSSIGLPADSIVLLSAGASFKYDPLGELDFIRTAEDILRQLPEAFILAAGVSVTEYLAERLAPYERTAPDAGCRASVADAEDS